MSSAEPDFGSLGLVLLAHTTRCIVTILSHCIDLLHANVRLISLWLGSFSIAAKLILYSIVESCNIVSASTNKTIIAWMTTIDIFFWTFPYTVFLFFILPCAVIVVLLERCETVYPRLRSSRFEAAVREYLGLPPLGRPYLDQSGPSIAATGRMLSVLKKSPSFQASTRQSKLAQLCRERCNRAQRFIKNLTICLLTLIEAAMTLALLKKTKEIVPTSRKIQTSIIPQKPVHLTLANQSYRVAQATNFISTVKRALLSKIVEHEAPLERQDANRNEENQSIPPSSSGPPRSTHGARRLSASFSRGGPLSSNPTVASSSITAITGAAAPSTSQHQGIHTSIHGGEVGYDTLRSAGSSPLFGSSKHDTQFFQQQPRHHPRYPNQGVANKKPLPKSRTLTVLSNLTASLSKSSLTSFTGSERKSSQPTVMSRKTSSSSTFASDAPTRTATPTTPDVNPVIVTTAQPSAYWTGRFLSLQDRFQGESLQDKTLSTFVTAHASKATVLAQQREVYQRRGNLPLSTTTALDRYGIAAIQEAERLSDEDNRCLRIFLHLDALCGTPEAQKSLHVWQQAYARRMRRDALLPQGTSMEKGFVARLFGGSSRRSLGASRSGKETTKGKHSLSAA
ncbi:hypothetical protein CI238_03178 [Colletotrichum incanum]|uniref:Uncharacterized protein n=1 Tax=Colletotrichum incanum TaxID=1573173 RepID=A0A167CDA9_COLIC|nr:hypothetical protein CI238_03178 [Colletotrichum incanum]